MKKLLSVVVFCLVSNMAHAGIWDSITGFFGGAESEEVSTQQEPVAAQVKESNKTVEMVKTGLQLLPLLTQTLGVTDGQAKGGMGAILQAAASMLSKTEYGALLGAIPGAKDLIAAAPALMGAQNEEGGNITGKLLGGAMDVAGKHGETLQQGANLVSQFKSLGLGADMIPKFGNVAGDFLESTDKPETSSLLTGALSQLKGLGL